MYVRFISTCVHGREGILSPAFVTLQVIVLKKHMVYKLTRLEGS